MISDNYVVGDNVYLRELHNFFFEVLGMMSITHYGAVGDGRVDNYGPLQVAIDDAKRRGLNYLYVPYGRFIYTGQLDNLASVTFIGNPHAHIVNIRTGEEIEIKQFGVETVATTSYEDLTNKPQINNVELTGDVSLSDLGVQGELTAGDNITITDNVIAATGGGGGSISAVSMVLEEDMTGHNGLIGVDLKQASVIGTKLTVVTPTGESQQYSQVDRVVVGAGVSYLKVSASLMVEASSTANDRYAYLIKKSGNITDRIAHFRTYIGAEEMASITLAPIIIPVQEGDEFWIRMQQNTGDTLEADANSAANNSWATYEAIG